ncbi:hypothetical protein EHI8A_064950 [Entamoeba histolytica HM-1:IMSS-B]|uniref:Uncharacterized protein n=6 Tax=Entamoeba histolytica TaxID=5759 RepID=C4LXF9_ENTH1|nr:hypothetical protein EHI_130910 [Entamoeba histolytica HM-1:IMSS]EMD46983.1 Hypothetical protein EHI5A_063190 [Entamoeba histolytica KU27]EMH74122.1 hypothetical protein EHI8A_064950 [Entamoeba histolytica HM-1:IMSS-B]EMS11342.1 hypothetical protein KM1_077470 [Entamoeba histolytica HM-3:IMSS]ENY65220.1 hypothetical protein EHI7A_038380 [Entamoeba histolytica HM-1:IMSS-A]GAT93438.1 hypothetical protein CL6EHI_130910 [Entamoeba histolytica]|eukprot:XP_655548.1 hypothetical protein EHI_130910 [Entamoeba histolytica HM-1:IMSS]
MTKPYCSHLHSLEYHQIFRYIGITHLRLLIQVSKEVKRCVESIDQLLVRHDLLKYLKEFPTVKKIFYSSFNFIIEKIPQITFLSNLRELEFSNLNCIDYYSLNNILQSVKLTKLNFCFLNQMNEENSIQYINCIVTNQPYLKSLKISKDLCLYKHYSNSYSVQNLSQLTRLTQLKIFSYSKNHCTLPNLQEYNVFVNDTHYFNETIHYFTQSKKLKTLILRGNFGEISSIYNVTKLTQINTLDLTGTNIDNGSEVIQFSNSSFNTIKFNGFFGINGESIRFSNLGNKFYIDSEIYLDREIGHIPPSLINQIKNELKNNSQSSIRPFSISILSNKITLQALIISTLFPHCYQYCRVETNTFNCFNFKLFEEYEVTFNHIAFRNVSFLLNFNVLQNMYCLTSLSLYKINTELPINLLTQLKKLAIYDGKFQHINNLKLEFIRFFKVRQVNINEVIEMTTLKSIFWKEMEQDLPLNNLVTTSILRIVIEEQKIPFEDLPAFEKKRIFVNSYDFEFDGFDESGENEDLSNSDNSEDSDNDADINFDEIE